MIYRLDLSSTAKAEAEAAFLSFSQYSTPERAKDWYQQLIAAIASLKIMPRRCPIARENAFFSQEIRQLLYGKGQHTYPTASCLLSLRISPPQRCGYCMFAVLLSGRLGRQMISIKA